MIGRRYWGDSKTLSFARSSASFWIIKPCMGGLGDCGTSDPLTRFEAFLLWSDSGVLVLWSLLNCISCCSFSSSFFCVETSCCWRFSMARSYFILCVFWDCLRDVFSCLSFSKSSMVWLDLLFCLEDSSKNCFMRNLVPARKSSFRRIMLAHRSWNDSDCDWEFCFVKIFWKQVADVDSFADGSATTNSVKSFSERMRLQQGQFGLDWKWVYVHSDRRKKKGKWF